MYKCVGTIVCIMFQLCKPHTLLDAVRLIVILYTQLTWHDANNCRYGTLYWCLWLTDFSL